MVMNRGCVNSLFSADDPAPVVLANDGGSAPVLVVSCHAGRHVPEGLDNLGLEEDVLNSHEGWDIGAGMAAERLCDRFDAPGVFGGYSRLVIDCNRRLSDPGPDKGRY